MLDLDQLVYIKMQIIIFTLQIEQIYVLLNVQVN